MGYNGAMENLGKNLKISVVGASGAVGREIISILLQRGFAPEAIVALASARSEGNGLEIEGSEFVVEQLKEDSFSGIDIALFSAGSSVSAEYAPIARDEGVIVIDNSSQWRMAEEIPLIVPEVNGDYLRARLSAISSDGGLIVANPNCSTIQMVVVLKPILDAVGIERLVVSTYQSVSGAGQAGMDELWEQTRGLYNGEDLQANKFPHRIAFNCLPHIDLFLDNGYTKEEMKMVHESRKILSEPELKITTTAVRVPVFACHGESINIETKSPMEVEAMRDLLRNSPGVVVMDDPDSNSYPLGAQLGGTDATYVGRIRKDESLDKGFNMWVVADNLRKGAALNSVQIAEIALASERFA